jgi:carbon-monoxide dehydrogenase medium subunit
MKPAPFRYYDPTSLKEALSLLEKLENAKVLAGGQSLVPMLNMRFASPDHVVDLNRIEALAGIAVVDGFLEIGAMTRQRDIEFSSIVAQACPLLSEAVKQIGHLQTRNRGTIGGSLCHLDPAAELVCVCAAVDAELEIAGAGGLRTLSFADFPLGYMTTALEPREILVKIRIPLWSRGSGSAFVEFARRHGDFALVSSAALATLDEDGRVHRLALTLGSVDVAPIRMYEVEKALTGARPTPELIRSACEACRSVEALDEPYYAPAPYKQHLAAAMSRRALQRAFERAQHVD